MKAYKFRIYPSKTIEIKLNRILNSCRSFYNSMLEYEKYVYEKDIRFASKIELNNLLPDLKIINSPLKEIHSQVLQNVNDKVIKSFSGFFSRIKKGQKAGYPRFRSRDRYNSFTYPQTGFQFISNKKLKISKIGEIPIKLHRAIKGKIKTLTIIKTPTDKWFAVFSCEIYNTPISKEGKHVGIDLGLTKFAVLSNGIEVNNPRYLKTSLNRLKIKSRQLSKKVRDSSNRNRSKLRLARLYEKISNQRLDFLHKLSYKLVNSYSLIAIEDLKIVEMKNKYLQFSINDASWNKFGQLLTYKAEEAGCKLICVEPRGTTQECSNCGEIVEKSLRVRIHKCPKCKLSIDRDLNSALNILNRAYGKLLLPTVGTAESNACGVEGIPLTKKQETISLICGNSSSHSLFVMLENLEESSHIYLPI